MTVNIADNNRIAKNTLFLYIRMIFVLLVSLYTSRVILNVLGVSDYGVYNVVAGFVSFFAFLNATLGSSLQRFYNYEGGRDGELGFVKVYSLGIRVHVILSIIVFILLETFGIWYINNVMVLPEGRLEAAHYLFQFSVISLILVIIQIPFSSVIIANEHMDFFAVVSILIAVLKLGIIIILPFIPYDKLIVYGSLLLIVSIIEFAMYTIYSKTKFKYLKLLKTVDKSLLKNIMSFSGWNLLGTLVFMLKGQGLNLLLNFFFGTVVNAARGVAAQVSSALMGFSSNITASFRPQMVSSYAIGNHSRALNLFKTQTKMCYCLMLMIITPVIFEIDLILHLWLGSAIPQDTNIFTILILIDALICVLNTPVTQMVYATGNIKGYQILTSSVNILLLPICWVFLKLGADAWAVFIIMIIVSIINQVVALIAMHKVIEYSYRDYAKQIVFPCVMMTLFVPVLPYFTTLIMPDSIFRIFVVSVASVVVTIGILFIFFLTPSEKKIVRQCFEKILRKFNKKV